MVCGLTNGLRAGTTADRQALRARIVPQTHQAKPRCWAGRNIGKWRTIMVKNWYHASGMGITHLLHHG
jgi:hypothetical protein